MPEVLLRLLKQEADLEIHMIVNNTAKLIDLLDHGDIDFAIVEGFFAKTAYDSLVYRQERYVPVCASSYDYQHVHSIHDLLRETLFVREAGSGTREMLERKLKEKNLMLNDFNHLIQIGNLNTIKKMVCAGAGISFFYQPVVQEELDQGILCEIPLDDFSVMHEFNFIWRKNSIYKDIYQEIYTMFK